MKQIKNLLRAAVRRTRSRAGETLTETLVALLIAAIAITMLASMIMTSRSLIDSSKKLFEAYYAQNNVLSEHPSSGGTAATAALSDTSTSDAIQLVYDSTGKTTVDVNVYENDKAPDSTPVTAYQYKKAGS